MITASNLKQAKQHEASVDYPISSIISIQSGALTCHVSLPENMLLLDNDSIFNLVGLVLSWLEDTPIYIDARSEQQQKPIPHELILHECQLTFMLSYDSKSGYALTTNLPAPIDSLDASIQKSIILDSFEQLLQIEQQYNPTTVIH